tara:strand:+ start:1540 stop:3378 length:1839 start_codon:yes stop_codon:yes gene_type:complete
MIILGISCYYHDSSAALLINGQIISAVQEERFSRIKGDRSFPRFSIAYCLDQSDIKIEDVDYIAFYESPEFSFKRIFDNLELRPSEIFKVLSSFKFWGSERLKFDKFISKTYPTYKGKFFFSSHHISHAASAFFPSGFKKAAILTIDGVGENVTSTISKGEANQITTLKEMLYPDSVGLLYSTITTFLGFKANSGEYKVMGLAPYGNANRFKKLFQEEILSINQDGSIKLNLKYFDFSNSKRMYRKSLEKLFNLKARTSEKETLKKIHMDIAASLQIVVEEIILLMAKYAKKITKMDNLCMSGGVALNCVSNGNLQKEKIFKKIWIQPASGDSGNSLGAALYLYHDVLKNQVVYEENKDRMNNSHLGPDFSDYEIKSFLDSVNANYDYFNDQDQLIDFLTEELLKGNIFGLFRGRMEFGPRALGCRSIIGDPRDQNTQTKMNLKIKFRESFRPFAPLILKDHINDWFDNADPDNKYMLFVNKLKKSKRIKQKYNYSETENMIKLLNQPRSSVPSITHVDYSARVQSVCYEDNKFLYKLLNSFYQKTEIPFLVNTSFNVRGEPIVCTPLDAYKCLLFTYMDGLCIGNFFIRRKDQLLPDMPPEAIQIKREITD